MSGAIKYFLDRIYYPCEDKIDGMPYALFVCAGNDGTGAIKSITRILKGLAIKQIQEPVLIVGDVDDSQLIECEELGMIMAAGLESGIF
jgi:multimeric flavodoxin WrbA